METTGIIGIIWGFYGEYIYICIYRGYGRGYIGVLLGLHWDYIGIMEEKMETTGIIGII